MKAASWLSGKGFAAPPAAKKPPPLLLLLLLNRMPGALLPAAAAPPDISPRRSWLSCGSHEAVPRPWTVSFKPKCESMRLAHSAKYLSATSLSNAAETTGRALGAKLRLAQDAISAGGATRKAAEKSRAVG